VLLAARLEIEDIIGLGWPALLFLAVLIFLARPLSVLFSTLRASLKLSEKAFLAWMAPRGIVAASVASLFAIELEHAGFADANMLVSVTFLVIIGTVLIYGLSASPLARYLGLAESDPQGLLFVGAHPGARLLASIVREAGFKVVLADTNPRNCQQAEQEALRAYCGNILFEEFIEEMDLGGIGRLLAITSNDEVNTLACLHIADIFGRANVFQLPPQLPEGGRPEGMPHLGGRLLFGPDMTFRKLNGRFEQGWALQILELDVETLADVHRAREADRLVPLFAVQGTSLKVVTAEEPYEPQSGERLIALVAPDAFVTQADDTGSEPDAAV
jgi:hypothetical protein